MTIQEALQRGIEGTPLTVDEAIELGKSTPADTLCDAADQIRRARTGDTIDTCSIVNARSGLCSEDCKWCAQSRHHTTGIAEYDHISHEEAMKAARMNAAKNVRRFSLVTSGRRVTGSQIKYFCDIYRQIGRETDLYLCASMGLLGKEELQSLRNAGVKRYHCNLETSRKYFGTLCSTHTYDEKLATIRAAREAGMEICSGGIIGMGETMRDRLEMVEEARNAGASSIPVNILQPIPGTALADTPLIDEDEIILTVALMRFVAPDTILRFAGGRARLSKPATERILHGGMNGALVGDMLTTIGNQIDEDYRMFDRLGFKIC